MYSLSLALLLAAPCAFALPAVRGPRVHNSAGTVEGNQLDRVEEYLGMPFGHANRYEAPVDFKGKYKNSFLETKYFGHACMQVGNDPSKTYGSEDCLYANIWKPSNATADSKLPVLCFINGGSWEFGEPEPYNGSALAYQHGVIYASIAYRTGPIGFAAFEADSKQGNTTGNWGMMDMQSGLRWLKREVANFGGDPDRITIHGQSSGGQAVELHYVMPDSAGLLKGIISESGGLGAGSLEEGISNTKQMGAAIKCPTDDPVKLKECLQKVPPIYITYQTYNIRFGPTVDHIIIPKNPESLLAEGKINDVAVIFGAQTNDSNREMLPDYVDDNTGRLIPMNASTYIKHVESEYGASASKKILAFYPPDEKAGGSIQNLFSIGSMSSDSMLCSTKVHASMFDHVKPGKAFMYRFNYWYQSNPECLAEANYHPPYMQGSVHEDETSFVMGQTIFMFDGSCCGVFGDHVTDEGCPLKDECTSCYQPEKFGKHSTNPYHAYFNDKEFEFSKIMGQFWTNFASSQNPNVRSDEGYQNSGDAWPQSNGTVTHNIVLDADLPAPYSKSEFGIYDNPAVCRLWTGVFASEDYNHDAVTERRRNRRALSQRTRRAQSSRPRSNPNDEADFAQLQQLLRSN